MNEIASIEPTEHLVVRDENSRPIFALAWNHKRGRPEYEWGENIGEDDWLVRCYTDPDFQETTYLCHTWSGTRARELFERLRDDEAFRDVVGEYLSYW